MVNDGSQVAKACARFLNRTFIHRCTFASFAGAFRVINDCNLLLNFLNCFLLSLTDGCTADEPSGTTLCRGLSVGVNEPLKFPPPFGDVEASTPIRFSSGLPSPWHALSPSHAPATLVSSSNNRFLAINIHESMS